MQPNLIKAEIVKAGTTQAAIASHLGVSTTSLYKVIHGDMRSARIEAALIKIVGRNIFPPKRPAGRRPSVWNGGAPA